MRVRLETGMTLLAVAGTALVAGCGLEPGEPLIALPERPATVLPSEVVPVGADGFPVILADPATVAGLPRPPQEIAAEEARLEARRVANQAQATRLARGKSSAAELAAIGRTHVEETRRLIEAGARPQTTEAPGEAPAVAGASLQPASVAAPQQPQPEAASGEPLDPNSPAPRSVGSAPPFVPAAVARP